MKTTVLLLSVFLAACLVAYATEFSSKLAESHGSLVTSAPAFQDPRTGGDVVVRGSLQAGDGDVANRGSMLVKAGDGKNGASGGNVLVGPGTHAAGAGGTTGRGGDSRIEPAVPNEKRGRTLACSRRDGKTRAADAQAFGGVNTPYTFRKLHDLSLRKNP